MQDFLTTWAVGHALGPAYMPLDYPKVKGGSLKGGGVPRFGKGNLASAPIGFQHLAI